jgi:hypothetical protein
MSLCQSKKKSKSKSPHRKEAFKQAYLNGPTQGNIYKSGIAAGYTEQYSKHICQLKWFKDFAHEYAVKLEKETGYSLTYFIQKLDEIACSNVASISEKINAYARAGALLGMKQKIRSEENMARMLPAYNLQIMPAGPDIHKPVPLLPAPGDVMEGVEYNDVGELVKTGGIIDLMSTDGGNGGNGH